jgi:hypothetical protein
MESNVLLQNSNFYITDINYYINYAVTENIIITMAYTISGKGSSVSIVTGYGLDGPGIESRREARFFTFLQTGLGSHTASCTMGTGSFPWVKSSRGVTLNPHPLLVPLVMKE